MRNPCRSIAASPPSFISRRAWVFVSTCIALFLPLSSAPAADSGAAAATRPDDSPAARRVVTEAMAERLEASYVLSDVARKMAGFLREQARNGAYDEISDLDVLAQRLTTDLRQISQDGHLRVRYHADPAQVMPAWNTPDADAIDRYRRHSQKTNFGFVRAEVLSGNIGYIRLDEFGDPALGGETAAGVMRFVAHTDALIIDLRSNGGGGGMGAVLATYLFGPKRVHLSNFEIRERNEIIQSWTAPFVPGPTYADPPVFVLTGPETASAAESFAYDLQALQRVRVVGGKTAGAANAGGFVRLSEHLAVFVPNGRPVNPITGTNWERVGVQPDVEVAVEQALHQAHVLALEQLLATPTIDPADTELRRKTLATLREARQR